MTEPGTTPQLDVYDIAYLAAGPDRVVDTALDRPGRDGPRPRAAARPAHGRRARAAAPGRGGGARRRGHPRAPLGRRGPVAARRRRQSPRHRSAAGRRRACSAAGPSCPRRTRRARVPTAAGRQLLRRLAAEPPTDPASDGGTSVLVALHGRDRLSDELRRSLIFESSRCRPPRSGRKSSDGGSTPSDEILTGGPWAAVVAAGTAEASGARLPRPDDRPAPDTRR